MSDAYDRSLVAPKENWCIYELATNHFSPQNEVYKVQNFKWNCNHMNVTIQKNLLYFAYRWVQNSPRQGNAQEYSLQETNQQHRH